MTISRSLITESLRSAVKSLTAKKMRSALSMLGIIVGIITISGLLTLSFGVRDSVTDSINGLGANLITVLPGNVEDQGFSAQFGASTLTERDVETIRQRMPEARNVAVMMFVNGAVRTANQELPGAFILAASPGVEHAFNFDIASGRLIGENDDRTRANVVVIGNQAAIDLFGETRSPLGKSLSIRGQSFQVIGVLDEIDSGASFGGPDMNSMVIVPLRTGWELTDIRQIHRIVMQAPDADSIESFKGRVQDLISENHGGEEDFSVLSQEDLVGMINEILDMLTAFVGAIAGISLLVGGIGIMNIMLVTVSERTREIGIRKAIGATRTAIMAQFLIESIILTGAAGVIAITFFSLAIAAAGPHSPIPLSFDGRVVGLAILFSAVVGVVFGIIPAHQASKKDPLVALRSE